LCPHFCENQLHITSGKTKENVTSLKNKNCQPQKLMKKSLDLSQAVSGNHAGPKRRIFNCQLPRRRGGLERSSSILGERRGCPCYAFVHGGSNCDCFRLKQIGSSPFMISFFLELGELFFCHSSKVWCTVNIL